jgi:hypothetical protein
MESSDQFHDSYLFFSVDGSWLMGSKAGSDAVAKI